MISKIYYEEFVYLFHDQPTKSTVETFINSYITRRPNFVIKWKDGDEMVRIARESDLQECISESLKAKLKYAKLYLSLDKPSTIFSSVIKPNMTTKFSELEKIENSYSFQEQQKGPQDQTKKQVMHTSDSHTPGFKLTSLQSIQPQHSGKFNQSINEADTLESIVEERLANYYDDVFLIQPFDDSVALNQSKNAIQPALKETQVLDFGAPPQLMQLYSAKSVKNLNENNSQEPETPDIQMKVIESQIYEKNEINRQLESMVEQKVQQEFQDISGQKLLKSKLSGGGLYQTSPKKSQLIRQTSMNRSQMRNSLKFRYPAREQTSETLIFCNYCSLQIDTQGNYFTCMECDDVDTCARCFEDNVFHKHDLKSISPLKNEKENNSLDLDNFIKPRDSKIFQKPGDEKNIDLQDPVTLRNIDKNEQNDKIGDLHVP